MRVLISLQTGFSCLQRYPR